MVKNHILSTNLHGVTVDRGTGHMLGWGQRIATRTSVESSSGMHGAVHTGEVILNVKVDHD